MTVDSYASKVDLIGDEVTDGYLSAADVAVVTLMSDDELARLLANASLLVDDLIGRATFPVDENGIPTDENIAAACRMATCGVIEQWLEVGEEHDVDGLASTQIEVPGYTGPRAPIAGPRVMRPLRRCGLLAQPGSKWDVT